MIPWLAKSLWVASDCHSAQQPVDDDVGVRVGSERGDIQLAFV